MCVAGGKRCEYSDALANVRKKTRAKLRNSRPYDLEIQVRDAVRNFQEANPELVWNHLPDTMPFQCNTPDWDVPESLKQMLGNKKEPVKIPEDKRDTFHLDLNRRYKEWEASLTEDEDEAVRNYTMTGYEPINLYLRRRGFAQWAKENPHMFSSGRGETPQQFVEELLKPRIKALDSALAKNVGDHAPEKLYRFYRVPAGVNPMEYAKRYFASGAGFKDKGFLSTSADPEYVASHIMHRSKGTRNKGYIVFEMLSNSGTSLMMREKPSPGWVQSLESEMVLPRNTGFRIVDTSRGKLTFGSHREDFERHYRGRDGSRVPCNPETMFNVPIVRMIDEGLIRQVRKGK